MWALGGAVTVVGYPRYNHRVDSGTPAYPDYNIRVTKGVAGYPRYNRICFDDLRVYPGYRRVTMKMAHPLTRTASLISSTTSSTAPRTPTTPATPPIPPAPPIPPIPPMLHPNITTGKGSNKRNGAPRRPRGGGGAHSVFVVSFVFTTLTYNVVCCFCSDTGHGGRVRTCRCTVRDDSPVMLRDCLSACGSTSRTRHSSVVTRLSLLGRGSRS